MDNLIWNNKRVNNKGSALVTVIIASFFLSIIVTILLFVTVRTYKSRQMDYQAKQNFYEAEKILDELKAVLIEDCSDCCAPAYIDVLNDYMNLSSAERKSFYFERFLFYENEIWTSRTEQYTLCEAVQNLLDEELAKGIESVEDVIYDPNEGFFILKGIVVSSSTIEGYYSRIKTDIRVNIPTIDWANGAGNNSVTPVDMRDYVIYANWQRD